MEEAGGGRDLVGDRAPVVPSCPVHVSADQRAVSGQKATKKKGERKMRGFKYRLWTRDRQGSKRVGVSVCVCVFVLLLPL